MKNLMKTLLILTIALFSFTTPGEESVYESANLNYSVVKTNGVVIFSLDINDPTSYDEIIVMRSDKPSGNFRNVKELSKEDINKLVTDKNIIDKYPLPSSVITYYKLQTIDKTGVYRSYPCVKLASK
jgi:hypothetical protein